MPEQHVHLLISKTPTIPPAEVTQVFKQRVARQMRGTMKAPAGQGSLRFPEANAGLRRFSQRCHYDFNVYTERALREKLDDTHVNPMPERLVAHPRDWPAAV
jgi:hypothetical protein